jgi:hypothetical protein
VVIARNVWATVEDDAVVEVAGNAMAVVELVVVVEKLLLRLSMSHAAVTVALQHRR